MRSNILMRLGLIGLGGLILPAAALAQAQPATQPAPHATTAAAPAADAAHQRCRWRADRISATSAATARPTGGW